MFQSAYAVAAQFTLPVVLSRKTVTGKCSALIGSYVVVNDEGWIVTAHHIAEQWSELSKGEQKFLAHEAAESAIRSDTSLGNNERRKRLAKLGRPGKLDTARASAWWGKDGLTIRGGEFTSVPVVDVAIAQLENFDPAWAPAYPKFKDPSKGFDPGKSLCRLGFPFHHIEPTWDDTKQVFGFTAAIPRFPIDGILTRLVQHKLPPGVQETFPMTWIETSSPGLRGQSGGPIFDEQGTIWGIQVQTAHFPLGFSKKGEPEQYLNVGLGVHTETLIGLFNQRGVKFEMSAY